MQRRRNVDAQLPCSLQVDHQLECGRLHHRKIARLVPFENATSVDPGLAIAIGNARSVTDDPSRGGELAKRIDRWHLNARRCCPDVIAPVHEKRIGSDEESIRIASREGGRELVWRAGIEYGQLQSQRTRGFLHQADFRNCIRAHRIDQHRDDGRLGRQLTYDLKPLLSEHDADQRHSSGIAAGAAHARDEAGRNRIEADDEHDRKWWWSLLWPRARPEETGPESG